MGNKHEKTNEKRTLKDKLTAVVLLESSKNYKEMDDALISECVDFLMELEEKKRVLYEYAEKKITEIPFNGKILPIEHRSKKKTVRTLVIIAAILITLFSLFCISSIGAGDKDEVLYNKFASIIDSLLPGESFETDGIAFIKRDEEKIYSSIEELFRDEGISLLYPGWMPENEKIDSVEYARYGDEEEYSCLFGRPDVYNFSVYIDQKVPDRTKAACKSKEIGDHTVYLTDGVTFVQAMFEYEGNYYTLSAKTEEEVIEIIENLKENE